MSMPANLEEFVKGIYALEVPEAPDIQTHRKMWRATLENLNYKGSEVATVEEVITERVQLRIYIPEGPGPFPLLVYYPGGGFIYSEFNSHEALCRDLCAKSGYVVVNVKTRVAPEHTPSEGLEDAYQGLLWCIENAEKIKGNVNAIILSGDSSGGNFAALTAIRAAKNQLTNVKGQLLIVPALDLARTGESHKLYDKGYLLDRVQWFFDFYLANNFSSRDPTLSPVYAEIPKNLPPAKIVFAKYDPVADDARLYYQRLKDADIEATLEEVPTIHGMCLFEPLINAQDYPETAIKNRLVTALNNFKSYF